MLIQQERHHYARKQYRNVYCKTLNICMPTQLISITL